MTLELARLLDAPALLTRFSRLVIDPNRGEDDPTLVMRLYDGTIIPAQPARRRPRRCERRLDALHRPYHRAIDAAIDADDRRGGRAGAGRDPFLHAAAQGPAAAALAGRVLWHHDGRMARPLIARLRAEGFCVGDNEPYSGELEGDTMSRHGTGRGLPHVLIELRQDLIATPERSAVVGGAARPHLERR